MPSTAIARFAFRPVLAASDVQVVSGRVYRYFAVPEAVAGGRAGAGSRGGYFNRAIRDRFAFERLRGWDWALD
ncbi:KTSC domain-containing protein [Pelagerythrobacter sp.]|uniref:KTSC domain-containing protein n=1 Tax=Pelagerythrobacter sp. TaxID=2800702 RepID=UPI0035B26CC2